MTKKAAALGGKLNANRPLGDGPDERPHGTRWKTGVYRTLTPDMVRQLAGQGMGLAQIAYYYGCAKSTVHDAINHDEELLQAWNGGLSEAIEKATNCLMKNITENNNVLAAMFLLKCKHLPGERGWIEEQYKRDEAQIEAPRVQIFLPDNSRDSFPSDALLESDI